MRYVSLAFIIVAALILPFAAKRALMGLSAQEGHDVRVALIMLGVSAVLFLIGTLIAKRDDISSVWRKRSGSKRIRLR